MKREKVMIVNTIPARKIKSSYRTEAVVILSALKIIEESNLNNTTEKVFVRTVNLP